MAVEVTSSHNYIRTNIPKTCCAPVCQRLRLLSLYVSGWGVHVQTACSLVSLYLYCVVCAAFSCRDPPPGRDRIPGPVHPNRPPAAARRSSEAPDSSHVAHTRSCRIIVFRPACVRFVTEPRSAHVVFLRRRCSRS